MSFSWIRRPGAPNIIIARLWWSVQRSGGGELDAWPPRLCRNILPPVEARLRGLGLTAIWRGPPEESH